MAQVVQTELFEAVACPPPRPAVFLVAPDPRAGWLVYRRLESAPRAKAARSRRAAQLCFQWTSPTVISVAAPTVSAFVSTRLISLFNRSRRLVRTVERLNEDGVLYVGDLAMLSRDDVDNLVGPFADQVEELADKLRSMGLSFGARLPWWKRPTDYYD